MNARRTVLLAAAALPAMGCASGPRTLPRAELVAQLRATESNFAATMARRDHDAFGGHIAEDAVFIGGGQPLHGKAAIAAFWKKFFVEPAAPFAWKPEIAEVGAEGRLGYTEGPVWGPSGTVFARFVSTWQRQPDDRWLIVFDNGYSVCKP